jgi:hypothetical protein
MSRLTYRDASGKAYVKTPQNLTFVQEGERVIEAIQKLAEYEDAEERNAEPRQLTLDELRQMEDGYIWIEDWSEDLPFKAWGEKRGSIITALIWVDGAGYGTVTRDLSNKYHLKLYGKEWTAYSRPPGGEAI